MRGIQLWSDWNADAHAWGARRNGAADPNVEALTVTGEALTITDEANIGERQAVWLKAGCWARDKEEEGHDLKGGARR